LEWKASSYSISTIETWMDDGSFVLKEESILKSIMHVLPNNNE